MEHLENPVENTINKMTDALAKELEALNDSELHDLFIFFYQINHQHYNTTTPEHFMEFLGSFKNKPRRKSKKKSR